MMEASNTESGNTKGTILGIENTKNLITIKKSRSFPANSEMKSQTVCRINIKNKITNTVANVIKKVLSKYLSNNFTKANLIY